MKNVAALRDLGFPAAVLGIVLVMIAPIPPFLLDLLISANIMLSVLVLLVSL
jgi:flagellar biosynthesis protein FlhA